MKYEISILLFLYILPVAYAQTTFHGDVAHTGVYQSPGPKQFKVKWKFKTEGPIVA